MINKKVLILITLIFSFISFACVYIVLPEWEEDPVAVEGSELQIWNAFATNISKTETGDTRIELTIRNDTRDWSTLKSVANKPALLKTKAGATTNCETVYVATGGHRLAPGFQMRGYSVGKADNPETQLLYVECKGADLTPGTTLFIDYISFSGILDDYSPEANKSDGVLEVNLDEIVTDLAYPIGTPLDGLIQEAGVSITGLSENVVTLLDTQRTDTGLQFTWQNFNPTKFPLKTHIGTPPVIGADGIIYGMYETLDIVSVPITPAKENMEWTTEVKVPKDVSGLYILLSVESKKPRTYVNYALDISDK